MLAGCPKSGPWLPRLDHVMLAEPKSRTVVTRASWQAVPSPREPMVVGVVAMVASRNAAIIFSPVLEQGSTPSTCEGSCYMFYILVYFRTHAPSSRTIIMHSVEQLSTQ